MRIPFALCWKLRFIKQIFVVELVHATLSDVYNVLLVARRAIKFALSFQPNTFQLVLIYDPARWIMSVMYLYETTGWNRYWVVRDSQIGFYVTERGRDDSRALAQSGKSSAFEMAETVGNTGE